MRQSRFAWFGVVDLVLVAAFAAVVGPSSVMHSPALYLMTVGGALAVLAGSVAAVEFGDVRVSWRHLFGVSDIAFAFTMPVIYAPYVLAGTATGEEVPMFGAGVGTALCIGFMGVDVARDGRHFQITGDVERVLSL